jgi:hypothetical protein
MVDVIGFDTKEALTSLIVGCHGYLFHKLFYLRIFHPQIPQHRDRTVLHDILGTGASRHSGNLGSDTLPDKRSVIIPYRNRPSVHVHHLMAAGGAYRSLPLDHELTLHQYLGPVGIFVMIQQFTCDLTAQFLHFLYLSFDRLLKHFVDDLEIAGEVCPLEALGKIHEDIKVGDEYHRSLRRATHLNQFFYVLDTYTGEVDPDVRTGSLNIRKIQAANHS